MPRVRTPRAAFLATATISLVVLGGCKSTSIDGAVAARTAALRPADAANDLGYFDALDSAAVVSFDDTVRGVLAVTGKDTSGDASARVARARECGLLAEGASADASTISLGQAAGLVIRGSGGEAASQDEAIARLREASLVAADASAADPASGPQLLAMLTGLRSRMAAGGGSFGPARAVPVAVLTHAPAAVVAVAAQAPAEPPAAAPAAAPVSSPPPAEVAAAPQPTPAAPPPPAPAAAVSAAPAAAPTPPAGSAPAPTPVASVPPSQPAPVSTPAPAAPPPAPPPGEVAPAPTTAQSSPPPPPTPPTAPQPAAPTVKPGKSPFTRGTPIPK